MKANIKLGRFGIALMLLAIFSQFDSSLISQVIFVFGETLYLLFGGLVTVGGDGE